MSETENEGNLSDTDSTAQEAVQTEYDADGNVVERDADGNVVEPETDEETEGE